MSNLISISRIARVCEPIIGESLPGFQQRLADQNRQHNPRWFYEQLGVPYPPVSQSPANLMRLASLARCELEALTGLSVEGDGSCAVLGAAILQPAQLERTKVQLCPHCIRECHYHRKLWLLWPYSVCHLHSVELVRSCPKCHRGLTWAAPKLAKCSCGFDLAGYSPDPASPEEATAAKEIADMVMGGIEGHAMKAPSEMGVPTAGQILQLAVLLGRYLIDSKTCGFRSGRVQVRFDLPMLMAKGMIALRSGESSIRAAVGEIIRDVSDCGYRPSTKRRGGNFYHYLFNHLESEALRALMLRIVGDVVRERNIQVVGNDLDAPSPNLSVSGLAKLLGRNASWLRSELVALGEIPAENKSDRNLRISQATADRLRAQWEDCLTYREAAELLGLSRTQLARGGVDIFCHLQRPDTGLVVKRREFSRQAVERFVLDLIPRRPYQQAAFPGQLTFVDLLTAATSIGLDHGTAVRAVLSRIMTSVGQLSSGTGVNSLLFDRDTSLKTLRDLAECRARSAGDHTFRLVG